LNIRTILSNIKFCKKDILAYEADALILIDYPGFNLRIAKWAKKKEIKVLYYISPQIWAWHSSRVHSIKASVDHMFVILPFEKDFYAKYNCVVDFVGHPLLDVVDKMSKDEKFKKENKLGEAPIIALLPGSRKQEIERMLNIMLSLVPRFESYQFVIAGAPSQEIAYYENIIRDSGLSIVDQNNVKIISNQTYALLNHASAALVTSGTATLETALFGVPQVVCYKGSWISYYIARHLVNISYISLVNLIVDRPIVKELIQGELTTEHLSEERQDLFNPERKEQLQADYKELREKLGHSGASTKAAKQMVTYLES